MNTRRQLTTVLTVSTGSLLIVALVAVAVLAIVRRETVRMSEKTSPLQVNFAKLQSGFERVSADFTRIGAAADGAELDAVESDAETTLRRLEATAAEIRKVEGTGDSSALQNVLTVHGRLKEIAQERLRAQRVLSDSSRKLAGELDQVMAAATQLAQSMEPLERTSEAALEAAKKTTQDANASIKAMLVLRESCEKLRGLIQEPRLIQKKYRLNVSKDKVKAVLDAMSSQAGRGDRGLNAEVAKFAAGFLPAFEGPNGLLAAREAQLQHPDDAKLAAAFESVLKNLNGSVDGLSAKVSENIDPLELAVQSANAGMSRSIETIVRVAAIRGNTAKVNAEARSLQVLGLRLAGASSEAELSGTADSIRATVKRALEALQVMRRELAILNRSSDVQKADSCARLFEQALDETTGENGMSGLLRVSLQKQRPAEELFREALGSIREAAQRGSLKTREAELAQDGAVRKIEWMSTLAFAAIVLLGAAGLIAAWAVGRRVRASILAGESRMRSMVSRMRSMLQRVNESAAALRNTSRELTHTSATVQTKLDSILEENGQMQQSIGVVGKSIEEVVIFGANASQVSERAGEAIATLEVSSGKIREVTEKIRGISFRTNLLAMNASIEAAHAGAAGSGFAVVADEVKSLATTSAEMTDEIDGCTNGMHAEVSRVMNSMRELQAAIASIRELQSGAAKAVSEHTASARDMSQSVAEAAATCKGNREKAGVFEMAKRLTAMAEKLEEACRERVAG